MLSFFRLFFSLMFLFFGISKTLFAASQTQDFMNLYLSDMPLRPFLEQMAHRIHKNIVLNSTIQGHLTLHLNNVSWKQVMDIVLRSQGLEMKEISGILYVTPFDNKTSVEKNAFLKTVAKPIHYAKASEIAQLLKNKDKPLLSDQGSVVVDERTNYLLLRDTIDNLSEIDSLIQTLDVPTPQIMIEAKIINIDEDSEKELGFQFQFSKNPLTSSRLQRDGISSPMAFSSSALTWLKIDNKILVDLELSALINEGKAQIISTPRILTSNQQTATIQSGEEIPYQNSVSQGVTAVAFKKAVLNLTVTPQIIPNHRILLDLKIDQDKRGSQEVLGMPSIDTRNMSTQVLIENGQTVVLGGLYEQSDSQIIRRIPILSDLPLLGYLFQKKSIAHTKRKLLIFVTPKIVSH